MDDLLESKHGLTRGSNEWELAKRKITTLKRKIGERFYGEYPDYWAWLVVRGLKNGGAKK